MCRNYDAGECVEDGCTDRITCHDFSDQRCIEHSYNGWAGWMADDEDDQGGDTDLAGAREAEAWKPDRTAQLEGYLEEIRYVYNHWHETARDEIGQVLVHYEFGDSPEVFEAFDPDVLDAD